MPKLDGDRQQLNQDGSGRMGIRLWIVLAIVLAAVVLGVWRHLG